MKLNTKTLAVIIGLPLLGGILGFSQKQQEKLITLSFTIQEVQEIYQIIDDAPLPGSVRKPLLSKIATQTNAQMPAPKDSTNKKKQ